MSDKKIEIDFKHKETEAGWIKIWDQFGLKGGPVWFDWLQWVLALGAFQFLWLKSQSVSIGIIVAISYNMLWLYFSAFFYRLEFKSIPFISTEGQRRIFSSILSGALAFLSWRVAITIARELAALQQNN